MIICITGTPGVGKTTVAKRLAEELGYEYVAVNDIAKNFALGYDEERDALVIDEEKLRRIRLSGNKVIDGHLSHYINCDVVVLLRCNPEVLKKRLKARGYSERKIAENVEAEALGVIKEELLEEGIPFVEIDTSCKGIDEVVKIVERFLETRDPKLGDSVDFTWYL